MARNHCELHSQLGHNPVLGAESQKRGSRRQMHAEKTTIYRRWLTVIRTSTFGQSFFAGCTLGGAIILHTSLVFSVMLFK